ncbi:MAG: triacylglycerol lipase [Acinetobacter sp.]
MKKGLLFISVIGLSTITHTAFAANVPQQVTSSNTISDYAKTQYPIAFVHGMFGFERLGFDSFGMDYFYQILPDLARHGATTFATQVSPVESSEIRGEQLIGQVEEIIAITGKTKVNLIGHSHAGSTIRYVEAIKPEYVASLTGVGATFRGSRIGDMTLENPISNPISSLIVDHLVGPILTWASHNPYTTVNMHRGLVSVSEAGSATFNATYPTPALADSCDQSGAHSHQGRYYYSWTGTSQVTNVLDVIDMGVSTLAPIAYGNLDNDGVVPRCSTHFGKVIRDDYKLTHLDETNLVLGLRDVFTPDPIALYRQHANRLKLQGL